VNSIRRDNRPTILLVSQVYVPDRGQYLADVAEELARRGFRVVVLTADRGYDDPAVAYPRRETVNEVEVRRVPFSSFGKGTLRSRILGGSLFLAQAFLRGVFVRRLCGVVVVTSPPMASLAAVAIGALRGVPVKYWILDVNPDQAVALGMVAKKSIAVRALDFANRVVLRRAQNVIVLDRFMGARVSGKQNIAGKLSVIPLWPHDHFLAPVDREQNPFRTEHGLGSRFVVMYSGNHGPSNPIDTLLEAVAQLRDDPRFAFVFIGGGIVKPRVDAIAGGSILSMPYEPVSRLKYSLAAADIHVVTQGDNMVGIVHPSKVYGAMAVARPIVFLGPTDSPVGDLISKHDIGWRIDHGDTAGLVALLTSCAEHGFAKIDEKGMHARKVAIENFSQRGTCGALCDVIAAGLRGPDRGATQS
jgi:glycosyltransferase involved in cell wall biosynthesis